ncbi:hypothetical protein F4680DRAFT_393563 [Xylaria scruposa]|nr:hypothetical protein F4680DRAFT_393563 [Xylaria scruposa]
MVDDSNFDLSCAIRITSFAAGTRPLTAMADTFPFIVTTLDDRSGDGKHKSVRSHVMRGKNLKRRPPRPPSCIGAHPGDANPSPSVTSVPAGVCEVSYKMRLSTELDQPTLEMMRQLRRAIGPPDLGLAQDQSELSWLEPIKSDPACLHFTMFVARMWKDSIAERGKRNTISQAPLVSYGKALNLLQQRFASPTSDLSTSDSSLLVVTGLVMGSLALRDFKTALNHVKGLHQMMALRGGLSTLNGNKQLQYKICRADISVALSIGCDVLFFDDTDISWEYYVASSDKRDLSKPTKTLTPLKEHIVSVPEELRVIWDDLSEVVRSINIAAQCARSIDFELYQEAMISIHYRLIKLKLDLETFDELVWLTLLGFCSGIFLQWRGVKFRFKHLARQLIIALCHVRLDGEMSMSSYRILLWSISVSAISVLDEQEATSLQPVLKKIVRRMGVTSWSEIQTILKMFPWIKDHHSAHARKFIEVALA